MKSKSIPFITQLDQLMELKHHVGKEIGLTDWLVIDQQRIDAFAKVSEDFQWIHTDTEKSMADSPFKKTVAHGFLILSMAAKFTYETLHLGDVGMGINYGLDKVRFTNAVPSGSRIRGRISLLNFENNLSGAKYKTQIVFELEGSEKPACVAELIAMVYTKQAKNYKQY